MTESINISYDDSGSFQSAGHSIQGFTENLPISQSKDIRDSIFALQQEMQGMESALDKFPLTHHFAPGLYAREMFLPAGYAVIGKTHKYAHLNIIVKGKVNVKTEDGLKELVGGDVFTSHAGTKRAVNVIEDTIWITLHPTEKTNVDDIENDLVDHEKEKHEVLK